MILHHTYESNKLLHTNKHTHTHNTYITTTKIIYKTIETTLKVVKYTHDIHKSPTTKIYLQNKIYRKLWKKEDL